MIISYVILHYQEKTVTEKCIESIMRQRNDGFRIKIFIVDNASPNMSGYELQKLYGSYNDIEVIINQHNEGFAKGNNIGIKHALDIDSTFIVVMNNDIILEDELFSTKIVDLYDQYHYGILGPDIYSVYDGVHQNPIKGFEINNHTIRVKILKARIVRLLIKLGGYKIVKKLKNDDSIYSNDYTIERDVDSSFSYILHGSCYVFAKPFLVKHQGFFDKTFMYYEEHILAYQCINEKIRMHYSPQLHISHYRNVATNKSVTNDKERELFFQENTIRSLKAFQSLLNN